MTLGQCAVTVYHALIIINKMKLLFNTVIFIIIYLHVSVGGEGGGGVVVGNNTCTCNLLALALQVCIKDNILTTLYYYCYF